MKRESLLQAAIVLLSIAFVVVCGIVLVTRGNPRCIRWKLKVGALLLNLTPVASGAILPGCVTCYAGSYDGPVVAMRVVDPVPRSEETLTSAPVIDLEVSSPRDLDALVEIDGGLGTQPQGASYSYRFCDGFPLDAQGLAEGCGAHAAVVQSGDLVADDGLMDSGREPVTIPVDHAVLTPGEYTLELHATSVGAQPSQAGGLVLYKVVVKPAQEL